MPTGWSGTSTSSTSPEGFEPTTRDIAPDALFDYFSDIGTAELFHGDDLGHVDLSPTGDGSDRSDRSTVEVHLHTTWVGDGDRRVDDGIRETLTSIKRQAEASR